jgi:hypothetical protein
VIVASRLAGHALVRARRSRDRAVAAVGGTPAVPDGPSLAAELQEPPEPVAGPPAK